MNCQQARRLLMTYLDSELDARSTGEVSEHLDGCPECRQRFAAEERLERGMADALGGGAMPADEWESLEASLRRPAVPWWRWAAAAAALVAALALLLQTEPLQEGLLHEMMRAHRAVAAGDVALDLRTAERDAVDAFLDERSLAALADGLPGTVDGHPLELVGVREERLLGQPAVAVHLRCCGTPTSLFVLRRERLDALPGEWQKALQRGEARAEGMRAEALMGDELFITRVGHEGHEPPPLRMLASL